MKTTKIVIGIAGQICAGKDSLTTLVVETLLRKHDISVDHFHFSDLISQMLDEMEIDKSREKYHLLSKSLFKHFGDDVLALNLSKKTSESSKDVVIWNGMRSPHDVLLLTKFANHSIIYIEANLEVRYQRLLQRKRNSGDEQKSLQDFILDQQRSTELYIESIKEKADLIINNENGLLVPNATKICDHVLNIFLATSRS